MIGDYNNEAHFHYKILINMQVLKIVKGFVNSSRAKIKFSKTCLLKIEQLGGFLSKPLQPLIKAAVCLVGNVIKPLPKTFVLPLGLTAAAASAMAKLFKRKDLDQTQQH